MIFIVLQNAKQVVAYLLRLHLKLKLEVNLCDLFMATMTTWNSIKLINLIVLSTCNKSAIVYFRNVKFDPRSSSVFEHCIANYAFSRIQKSFKVQ